ncbi:ABC-type glycerol-3-phosphate transport system substrate-binding protein [Paenibacillus taihuensis]|uniref:ABC-type glycerol-3-phosphate transport system substrate-binding protein n=1 Tax=Paenibacillus taihuensis TaxID=1156355 RepID=A0A3D9QV56_9BACL|nr:hypothetical protein [Paenibacillus taihuensis]REE68114.1 ABC-type glycerol-3-phosphate transport system substrate-binding protein [Paenibacillus taihuensis]
MSILKKRTSWIAIMVIMTLLALSACSGNKEENNTSSSKANDSTNTTNTAGTSNSTDTSDANKAPAANNSTGTTENTAADSDGYPVLPRDPITLRVFIGGADTDKGIWNTTIAQEIKKKLGITLDFITGDDVKAKTMIAGGDLPDVIMTVGSVSALVNSMIQGGQVIPLDDLIDKYGPNIKKYTPGALEIMKKVASNNTGKVYFLPVRVSKANDASMAKDGFVGFYTRWDLYKGVGAPAMNNEDDFLKVNKEMQDKYPTTKDGKKTYAFSAWGGELFPYIISYPHAMGWSNWLSDTSLNATTGDVSYNFTEKDGVFWKGIKFFNKAYRMGIFDPEGITQKIDQYIAKLNSGQVFNSAASFWMGGNELIQNTGNDNAQLLQLPGPFPGYLYLYPIENPGGNSLSPAHAITKANKYPERTMELFNYLSGTEGGRLLYTGVKGVDWDVVDGKPKLIGKMANPSDPGYADYLKSVGTEKLNRLAGLIESYPAEDGYPLDLKINIDPATVTKAEKELAQQFGADLYPGQVYDKLVKEGKGIVNTTYFPFTAFVKQPSEQTAQTLVKAEQYFMANVAKYIMAKDDAAFDAAQQKAIDDFNAMGVDKAYDEFRKLIDDAKEFAKTVKLDQ